VEWNRNQEEALQRVGQWLNTRNKPYFYLAGYAGTGKTTLAKHFVQGIAGKVLFGAYTGKAAHVLHKKGCVGATTIHRMIYQPKNKAEARLIEMELALRKLGPDTKEYRELAYKIKREKIELRKPFFVVNIEGPASEASLIVIDECSMVSEEMGHDLLGFRKPILVLGDPGQLPPVKGTGFFTNKKPDYMLTEIMRQEKDNPIIRLATDVREGRTLKRGQYGSSRVIDMADISNDMEMDAGQILCGMNRTRKRLNKEYRRRLGFYHPYPLRYDKLVCLRNDYDLGLLNGSQWTAEVDSIFKGGEQVQLDVVDEDSGLCVECDSWTQHFEGDPEDIPYAKALAAQEFDYGYCMTVHKSQGSQWDDVLLYDESHVFTSNRREWLYTGITRAAETITIGV
jgi:exodeoxyribonuclease V